MECAAGEQQVVDWRRNVLLNRSGEADGTDDGLRLIKVSFESEQEGVVFVVTQGTGERTFVILAVFRRLDRGEGVGGIENGIAKQEVERAVKVRRAGLGGDFEARAAGVGEKRGVGI